jgi:hypothetical protein
MHPAFTAQKTPGFRMDEPSRVRLGMFFTKRKH